MKEDLTSPSKRLGDDGLQPMLEEDDDHAKEQLTDKLDVLQSNLEKRFKTMGNILKFGRWETII